MIVEVTQTTKANHNGAPFFNRFIKFRFVNYFLTFGFNLKIEIMKKIVLIMLCISYYTNAQVPSYVPTIGLVGYWPFNGNANDASGNGNNGTVTGATLTTDRFDNTNTAYSFNGVSDFISIPNIAATGNSSRSFNAWVRLNNISDTSPSNYMISTGSPSTSSAFNFRLVEGKLSIMGYSSATPPIGNDANSSTTNLSVNSWYFCSVTYDGSNVKFYLNGVLLDTILITNLYTTSGQNNYFGKSNHIGWEYYLNGKTDDISIYNRALSQQEITNLYNSENANECLTMVINTGILSTTPVTYTSSVSIYPNPANDQITIDCGNLANVTGWGIKITNILGQEVFNKPMNTPQYVVPLNTWTGQGMYFVKIINAQNEVVNIKKIILQ